MASETLSPAVASLISTLLNEFEPISAVVDIFNEDLLHELYTTTNAKNTYPELVKVLRCHLHPTVAYIKSTNPNSFLQKYSHFYDWLCIDKQELENLLIDSCSMNAGITHSSLLRVCCVMERSMRNLLLSATGTCPMMLKDIIKHEAMFEVLGEPLVKLLDVLVGPPTSLNIRNLIWHGFGSESEDMGRFSPYLIWFTGVIGKEINHNYSARIEHFTFEVADLELMLRLHPPISTSSIGDPIVMAKPVKSYQIHQAFRFAEESKFGVATAMLLTAFEHLVRVAYCQVNECPERRMTAVSSEYFITLDHVFEELQPNGHPNTLYSILPDRLRTAIYDLLLYPNGIRLRDRLSHMEISYLEVTEALWLYTLNIVTAVLSVVDIDRKNQQKCLVLDYLSEQYVPVYHPVADLLRLLHVLHTRLDSLSIATPEDVMLSLECDKQCSFLDILRKHFYLRSDVNVPAVDLFSIERNTRNLSVLSQFDDVREWCKMCDSVAKNLLESLVVLGTFSDSRIMMYNDQQLRSRQRKNYFSFQTCRPCIQETIRCVYMVLVSLTNQMNMDPCLVTKREKRLIQLSENILTLTQQNKWSQCTQFLSEFITIQFSTP